jgi:hypothetical protein
MELIHAKVNHLASTLYKIAGEILVHQVLLSLSAQADKS